MAVNIQNNTIKNIGTNYVSAINTDALTKATVIGLSLTNLTEQFIYIDVIINDGIDDVYYLKNTLIPNNTSLRALSTGEKLVLNTSNTLKIKSSIDNSADAIISFAETT